jgi:hypothetical protein
MNYLAHGRRYLDRPSFLAGTAIPDWLNVVNRRIKARPKATRPLLEDSDKDVRELAAGILQHHHDDGWFHRSESFIELTLMATYQWRELLGDEDRLRRRFLGHIVVELLLDAELARRQPALLDDYYLAMQSASPGLVQAVVQRITGQPVDGLARLVEGFCQVRFLYDYLEDGTLLERINQVLKRVGVEELPGTAVEVLARLRPCVAERADQLLSEPAETGTRVD